MFYADYRDNLMPGVTLADLDREAYGCYSDADDGTYWCIGCMLELTVGPDGVPESELCDGCQLQIALEAEAAR